MMAEANYTKALCVSGMEHGCPEFIAEPDRNEPWRMQILEPYSGGEIWLDQHGAKLLADFLSGWEAPTPPSNSDESPKGEDAASG